MQSLKNSHRDLGKEAEGIVSFVRECLLDEEGLLIMGIRDTGEKKTIRIIDDFGDVAPFIALYGGEDICLRHLELIRDVSGETDFDRAFAYTDLIFGLIWYSRVGTHQELSKELALTLAQKAEEKWFTKDNLRSIEKYGLILPIANGMDTTYIEVWTEMYQLTGDEKWLRRAEATFSFWKCVQDNNPSKLIPIHTIVSRNVFLQKISQRIHRKIRVMKDNTNYGFGLLDLYRITQEVDCKGAFDALHKELSRLADSDNLKNIVGSEDGFGYELLPTFAYVDMCCDAYQLFKEERYLTPAKRLSDKWITLQDQNKNTGLFPKSQYQTVSYMDSETDMGVALLKMYECTGEEKYLNSASRVVDGLLTHHVDQNFPLEVDVSSGEVRKNNIKTKFVALMIKFLHIANSEGKIYHSDELFMLAKDR